MQGAVHSHRLFLVLALAALPACGDNGVGTEPPEPAAPLVTTTMLDFGSTDCGSAATVRGLVVSNTGGEAYSFTTALAGGASSPYLVTPEAGSVGPQSQIVLLVIPKPVPAVSATTANLYGDTLTVTTEVEGDVPHVVALQQSARGVIITAANPMLNFAAAQPVGGAAQTLQLMLSNTGNVSTTLSTTSSAEAFSMPTGLVTLDAGASVARAVSFSPLTSGAVAGKLAITATGPLCAPLPTATVSGNGTFANTAVDVLLTGPLHIRKGSSAICVRLVSGHVACLGADQVGVRGAGPGVTAGPPPNLVRTQAGPPLDGVVELVSGRSEVCARRTNGSVWCWGNILAQAGKLVSGSSGQPFATEVITTGAISIAMNYGLFCAVTNPNGVLGCSGQLAARNQQLDLSVWTVSNATRVSLGGMGGFTLHANGTVTSLGLARNGNRGNGDPDNAPPSLVTGLTTATAISATTGRNNGNGSGGACAMLADATAKCWGGGRHGKLGDAAETNTTSLIDVQTAAATPLAGVTLIESGRNHRCAIATGGVHCWGRGDHGQLGRVSTGSNGGFAAPTDPAITNAVKLDAEGRGTCVVTSTRRVICFGETAVSNNAAHVPVAAFEPLP